MVKTNNRGGTTLRKGFTVWTNDPAIPKVRLHISGKVKGYVTVSPKYIRLSGPTGQPIQGVVNVTPLDGYPMTIKKVEAQKAEFVRYELQPLAKNPAGKGYRLVVENTRSEPGSYNDTIIIKTDSRHKPTLRIPVYGRIFEPQQPKRPGGTPSK